MHDCCDKAGARRAAAARATLVLARNEVLCLRMRGLPYRVTCVAGLLWATAEPSPQDRLLGPGEEAAFAGRGRVVIQALRRATVRLECPGPARLAVGPVLRLALGSG